MFAFLHQQNLLLKLKTLRMNRKKIIGYAKQKIKQTYKQNNKQTNQMLHRRFLKRDLCGFFFWILGLFNLHVMQWLSTNPFCNFLSLEYGFTRWMKRYCTVYCYKHMLHSHCLKAYKKVKYIGLSTLSILNTKSAHL